MRISKYVSRFQFKVPEKDQRDKWIIALESCFNCICKRTDLMCKGNCDDKLTGYIEEYDPLELGEDEKEVEENIYNEPGEDDDGKGPKGKVLDFEKRWEAKVRLIPEALDCTYVYYDPHEEENRKILNSRSSKPSMKKPPQSVSPVPSSVDTSISSSTKKPNLQESESKDYYTDNSGSETGDSYGSSYDPGEEHSDGANSFRY